MKFEFYDGKRWAKRESDKLLPQAVRLKLTLNDYGEIERIYLTPNGTLAQVDGDSDSESSGSDEDKNDVSELISLPQQHERWGGINVASR